MKEFLQFVILLVWVGIISLAAIGLEKLLDRMAIGAARRWRNREITSRLYPKDDLLAWV